MATTKKNGATKEAAPAKKAAVAKKAAPATKAANTATTKRPAVVPPAPAKKIATAQNVPVRTRSGGPPPPPPAPAPQPDWRNVLLKEENGRLGYVVDGRWKPLDELFANGHKLRLIFQGDQRKNKLTAEVLAVQRSLLARYIDNLATYLQASSDCASGDCSEN